VFFCFVAGGCQNASKRMIVENIYKLLVLVQTEDLLRQLVEMLGTVGVGLAI